MIDIKIGDCRKLIHELEDESVDCVMTSPPYWGLRDYGNAHIIFDGKLDCDHSWDGQKHVFKMSGGTGKTDVGNYSDDRLHFERETNFCSKCGAWRGQLGLEPTLELYIKHMLDFFDDVKMKLKAEGNCFVNLGDTYNGSGNGNNWIDPKNKERDLTGQKPAPTHYDGIPKKCLCMVPQRFAWGMIERGWILRNEIIWYKPNHMPESVTDRLTKAHEVIYHFVKQQRYYYNLDAIREPLSSSSIERITQKTVFKQPGGLKQDDLRGIPENGNASRCNKMVQSLAKKYNGKFEGHEDPESLGSPRARTQRTKFNEDGNKNASGLTNSRDYYRNNGLAEGHPLGKNPGDVWEITTQPYPESHFAVFPLELVRRPILAGCPIGGTVLDPFGGSGTVGEFCRHNDRNAILFELNPEYGKLIKRRSMANIHELGEYI